VVVVAVASRWARGTGLLQAPGASLLRAAGLGSRDATVEEIVRRTEGWAAGLYLATACPTPPTATHPRAPWAAVQVLLELIHTLLGLADPVGARTLLAEIVDIQRRYPELGTLGERVEEVRRLLATMPAGRAGVSALTAAELRLIPYLHTHLSFRDIAQRLFVSHTTVKTQAISLYRKLGVSSRGAEMERAEELGLIDR